VTASSQATGSRSSLHSVFSIEKWCYLAVNESVKKGAKMVVVRSQKWGYVRIIAGTIFGGILGFYVMDRLEKNYKEKMNERLRKYEQEMKKKEEKMEESL
ncbi:hypothetical protein F8388_010413, partial [Cannabis sativa]